MPETAEIEELYSVIEESAGQLDVPCDRGKVMPILTAYESVVPVSAVAFRVETSARRGNDLSCRLTMIPPGVDTVDIATSNGLMPRTDHPIGTLSSDISERCPIDNYGVDFGVVGGFTKTFQFFPPDDLQDIRKLVDIPTAPRALGENIDFFVRHGVDDQVALTGMDYQHKTFNVYLKTADGYLVPENIRAVLSDLGLPEPSEDLLRLGGQAGGFYVTFRWDTSEIQRISFSAMTPDPKSVTNKLAPKIDQLAKIAPSADAGAARMFICYVASSPDGEYYKLLSFYRSQPEVVKLWGEYEDN
ncbi:aromatic prenyltransferase [Streptomyces sp. B8F3]|uniref:aromatic prenyltransferase n=1 Tax=unclassified Streptomyces TaxID=2593676 RepID=UPI00325C7AF3